MHWRRKWQPTPVFLLARNLIDDWGFSKIQKKPDTHSIGIELREPLNEIISEKKSGLLLLLLLLETGKS